MPSPTILVDAHVHCHSFFDRVRFLDAAAGNFASAARTAGVEPCLGVLMLTEIAGSDAFERFRASTRLAPAGPWRFEESGEAHSLFASRGGSLRLMVVAGHQRVTAEGLEVLALGSTGEIEDGLPIRETLAAVQESNGLPVVPWGAGKWWFRRGKVVAELIDEQEPQRFFLGDNGGRPALMPRPPLFARAERKGIRVLPGTDPLPLAGEIARIGTYGFLAAGPADPASPASALVRSMLASDWRPTVFGACGPWGGFLRNQFAMKLRR